VSITNLTNLENITNTEMSTPQTCVRGHVRHRRRSCSAST